MFDLFSPFHIIVLLVIVLLIFGPKRLPELGRGLGQTMKMFRDAQTGREAQTREDDSSVNMPKVPEQE